MEDTFYRNFDRLRLELSENDDLDILEEINERITPVSVAFRSEAQDLLSSQSLNPTLSSWCMEHE